MTNKKNILDMLPGTIQKLTWDLTSNMLDVANEKYNNRASRLGNLARVWDTITGNDKKSELQFDKNILEHQRAQMQKINMLMEMQTTTNIALIKVRDDLQMFKIKNIELINSVIQDVDFLCEKVNSLEYSIEKLQLSDNARQHKEYVLSKFRSGKYNKLSPIQAIFCAFDDLFWGAFGLFCFKYPEKSVTEIETLKNEVLAIVSSLLSCQPERRISSEIWLKPIDTSKIKIVENNNFLDCLAYQGNWSSVQHNTFSYVASQKPDVKILQFPILNSPDRVVSAIGNDFFEERLCQLK